MTDHIIGREKEVHTLKELLTSPYPEFLALYGRRRIGKTFLIRRFFEDKDVIFFDITGAKKAPLREQTKNFIKQIGKVFYNGAKLESGKTWDRAFELLTDAIENVKDNQKVILFFDEFPWMATKNSRLVQTLEFYWNQHWSKIKNVKLIICGSSASWIIEKIINNKDGLHNRLTRNIYLEPFNLKETKQFLEKRDIKLSNEQVLQLYMAMGGIPYYLSKVEKGYSAMQNIEQLAFTQKSFLLTEFDNLFSALFDDYEICIEVLRLISNHKEGIGQDELLKKVNHSMMGQKGLKILKLLKDTSFIKSYKPQYHRKKGIYYKVVDQYVLFYFYWIEPIKDALIEQGLTKGYWEHKQTSPAWNSWSGYAFESICLEHIPQISQALNLSPTAIPYTWRYVPRKGSKEHGTQIDLLFDREDGIITVCEIKYTRKPFEIDKSYSEKLLTRIKIYKEKTRTNKQIFLSFICVNGLKKTIYSEDMVTKVIDLNSLF
jgi:uncharacterized protein